MMPAVTWAMAVLFAGALLEVLLARMDKEVRWLTLATLIVAILSLFIFPSSGSVDFLRLDAFGLFFSFLLLAVSLLVALSSSRQHPAYDISLLFTTLGMLLAVSADDLILLYLSIELISVPSYVLISIRKSSLRMEAAIKYFILSMVASAFLILGIGLISLESATTSISGMSLGLSGYTMLGLMAALSGLAFKLGVWPFNFWIPDVYQGSDGAIAGLLAGGSKKAAFAVLIRLTVVVAPFLHSWGLILAILAAVSMTVPNLIAMVQKDPRRLVAYSIMTHAGYLLMGIAIVSRTGYTGALFHGATHAFMALGALLVLGIFASHRIDTLEELQGVGFRNPFLALALTIFLLSLAGIPLLSGFASKLYVFSAVATQYVWLTSLAVLNSAIALYYYFRILHSMYGFRPSGKPLPVKRSVIIAVSICLVFTVLLGIYPQPLLWAARLAVESLF